MTCTYQQATAVFPKQAAIIAITTAADWNQFIPRTMVQLMYPPTLQPQY
jgi:hypothetical protein